MRCLRRLGITTVRDRIYRGPCRTAPELETFFGKFRAIKSELPKLYDAIPEFDPGRSEKRWRTSSSSIARSTGRPT